MIKVYSKQNEYIKTLSSFESLKVTEELKTGYRYIQFHLPFVEGFILEEQKIEYDDYMYVVKEVEADANGLTIYCKPNFGTLNSSQIDNIIGYGMTFKAFLDNILAGTGWTSQVEIEDDITMGVKKRNETRVKVIEQVAKRFDVEIYFDTKKKIIYAWKRKGKFKQSFIVDQGSIADCLVESNTYNLVTRLYATGNNFLTMQSFNDGKPYIENFDYTDEVIVGYLKEDFEKNPADLLTLAKAKLEKLSKPVLTYTIASRCFTEELEIGDTVKIIDTFRGLDTAARVQKIVTFPLTPVRNRVILGEPEVDFNTIYTNFNQAVEINNANIQETFSEMNMVY